MSKDMIESREDFTTDMDLAQFSQITFGQLCGSARLVEVQWPERHTLGGFDALQIDAAPIVASRYLAKYLHGAISGQRGFHQVIVWSAPSAYDRAWFDRLLEGFREHPGPNPNHSSGQRYFVGVRALKAGPQHARSRDEHG